MGTQCSLFPPAQDLSGHVHLPSPAPEILELCEIDSTCELFIPPYKSQLSLHNFDHVKFLKEIRSVQLIPENLLFHQILPFAPKTRQFSQKLKCYLDNEFDLMTRPQTHTESQVDKQIRNDNKENDEDDFDRSGGWNTSSAGAGSSQDRPDAGPQTPP